MSIGAVAEEKFGRICFANLPAGRQVEQQQQQKKKKKKRRGAAGM